MSKIGIFYGSTNGTTADAAETIKKAFGEADVHEVSDDLAAAIAPYDLVVLGTSTWGDGDLQDDWDENIDALDSADFSGKKVALFGMGDQEGYPDTYLDGMGTLYEKAVEKGAAVIGEWPTDGYEFDASTAEKDGKFVGLALDEDNQSELSEERIQNWVAQVKGEM